MAVINCYDNAACTHLFMSIPAPLVAYTTIECPMGVFTAGGKSYRYFAGWGMGHFINGIERPASTPFLSWNGRRLPLDTALYFKNGLNIQKVRESNTQMKMQDFRYGNAAIPGLDNQSVIDSTNQPYIYAVTLDVAGTFFIGFLNIWNSKDPWENVSPAFLVEESFWRDAFRDPYDYGTQADLDGGQGTGQIPNTGVTRSATPSDTIPTGGRGLHCYVISPTGYQELQGYLWGEGSTTAKALWQKFQNKTHNPTSCIVGCFKLPSVFMPTIGSSSGVQLAGLNLAVSGASAISPGISTLDYDYGVLDPPFQSFLDYVGLTCKIYVPFCGEFAVPAEKVLSKAIKVSYRCDVFNGNIAAAVFADNCMLAEMTGNVAYSIPVSGGDDGTLARIGALATAAVSIATIGSGAAAISAAGGASAAGSSALAGGVAGIAKSAGSFAGAQFNTYTTNCNTAGSVNRCINGHIYVEYIYPSTAYPYQTGGTYGNTYGYPAVSSAGKLSAFSGGYGEFDVVQTENSIAIPNATTAEKNEIIRLLAGGVIV